jgi:hypothetical protein
MPRSLHQSTPVDRVAGRHSLLQVTPLQPAPRAQPTEHLSLVQFPTEWANNCGFFVVGKEFDARNLQSQYGQSFDSSTFLLLEIQMCVQAFEKVL